MGNMILCTYAETLQQFDVLNVVVVAVGGDVRGGAPAGATRCA